MEEFIITFRESLEAALVVGIIFSYLKKSGKMEFKKFIYLGIFLGILGSIFGAVSFRLLAGGFSGISEMIFEGTTMMLGAVLIVYLIVWMANKKDTSRAIKQQVEFALSSSKGMGLMFLVFVSILREGVETTLFLNATMVNQSGISLIFATIGILGGLAVGYGVYLGLKGMNLRYLFNISSTLLMLFATGLFARGIHEFQEAGVIPTFIEHIWDVNYIVDENGFLGGFMKSLFGYNGNPSLTEVIIYIGSLMVMLAIYNKKRIPQIVQVTCLVEK
jgi:high-affinity iron transporter